MGAFGLAGLLTVAGIGTIFGTVVVFGLGEGVAFPVNISSPRSVEN